MKRRTALILLAVFTVLTPAASVLGSAAPRAVPLEPVKEFSVVAKGEVIKHSFEIRNEGDAPLELTEVRPACGCTVAKFDRTIAPGGTGKVHVEVKTDNFAGPISKSIAVFTNDAGNPKLQLAVKAHVKPYIQVLPGYARYNYVQGEPVGPLAQTLWAEDGKDLKVRNVKRPYEHLEVTYREATEEERNSKGKGRQWRVELHLSPDSPVGALRDYVEIELDHPEQKVVKIPISGFVRPRQHITPHTVDFGELKAGDLPLRRTFSFTNFINDPIELKSVDTGFEAISAEVQASKKEQDVGYRFQLMLTIGPEMPKGEFGGTVKVHITDEQNPVVELPIKGTIL